MPTAVAASAAPVTVPASRRWFQGVLLVAPAIGLAVLGWRHRFITDDGFIFLRVVDQITAGHGPVFNSGQRVEAFTSPLWLAVLTVLDVATPFRLEWIAVAGGVILTGVGLALSCFGAARLLREPTRSDVPTRPDVPTWRDVSVPVGALVPLAIAPMWYFATSGLETGLTFGWIGVSMWILAGWARRDEGVRAWEAIVLGIGWLVRPDLLPMSIAFAGALLFPSWRASGWRDRGRILALMFALPLLYQVLRMGYYGALVPNTAIAKEATLSRWDAGWRYVGDLGGDYWLWIPILALVVGAYVPLLLRFHRSGATRELAVVVAFPVGAALQALYIVKFGGDYFPGRLLLPAVFAFCAPVAITPWRREFAIAFAVLPWALVCATTFRPAVGFDGVTARGVTVEEQGWGADGGAALYNRRAVYYGLHRLDVRPEPGLVLPTASFRGIGLPGYAVGPELDVLDLLGLADPVTARLQIRERGVVGHEKQLPGSWAAARLAARGSSLRAEDFPSGLLVAPMIPVTEGAAFAKQAASGARAALRCPALAELRESYSAPISIGRFVSNLAYSFDSTRLRIPADPKEAYRKFCGPGSPPGT